MEPVTHAEELSSSQNPLPPNNLHIERSVADLVILPPKGALRHTMHNTSTCAAQNYNIVEDLAQASSAMSALEVLQMCPAQRKAFLQPLVVSTLRIPCLQFLTWKSVNLPFLTSLHFRCKYFRKVKVYIELS